MEHQWNDINGETEELKSKIYPSATLSTTNPTWTALNANPDLHRDVCD
jgi:hypothetical protein